LSQIAPEPASIERALQDLWRGEAARDEGSGAMVCARTVNLVVCCASAEDPDVLNRELEPATASHPGRVIVIAGSSHRALEARVSASCLTSHAGDRYLGREMIVLRGGEPGSQQLTSIVSSLLLPDLPVFLWWRDLSGMDSELFASLVPRASRVIVDSAAAPDLHGGLNLLLRKVRQHRAAAFTDLAWTRVTPWRQLAAQFFDNPAVCSYVARLQKIDIEYVGSPQEPGQARPEPIFLGAWLAIALGHAPERHDFSPNHFRARFTGGKVPLDVNVHKREGGENWIQQVVLEAPGAATFRMARTADGHGFTTTSNVSGQPPVHRTVRSVDRGTADCLTRELNFPQRDELYERVLEMSCQLGPERPK
jgi:glucose-6-phosphate dehydrogenase assembly protein OpcA